MKELSEYAYVDKIDSSQSEMKINKELGDFGVISNDFNDEFNQIVKLTDSIKIWIDSPGGSYYTTLSIIANLQRAEVRTIAHVTGAFAASGAAYIALSCDVVLIDEVSQIMLHSPGMFVQSEEHKELLEKYTSTTIDLLATKTKLPKKQVKEWMSKDTWFTAAEALEVGLVDQVIATPTKKRKPRKSLQALFDNVVAKYEHKTKNDEVIYTLHNSDSEQKENKAEMKQVIALLDIDSASTENEIVAKIKDLKNELAISANSIKELERDKTLIETDRNTLKAKVEVFEKTQKEAKQAQAAEIFKKAVERGAISATQQDKVLSFFEHDFEGTKSLLESLSSPKNAFDILSEASSSQHATVGYTKSITQAYNDGDLNHN